MAPPASPAAPLSLSVLISLHSPLNFLSVVQLCPLFPLIHPQTIAVFLCLSFCPAVQTSFVFIWRTLFSHFLFYLFFVSREEDKFLFETELSIIVSSSLGISGWFWIWDNFRRNFLLHAERNNWNPLLSDGRLALTRQLCNYGVQAWGWSQSKNKQRVVIGGELLRSHFEVERETEKKKFVDEIIFTSLGNRKRLRRKQRKSERMGLFLHRQHLFSLQNWPFWGLIVEVTSDWQSCWQKLKTKFSVWERVFVSGHRCVFIYVTSCTREAPCLGCVVVRRLAVCLSDTGRLRHAFPWQWAAAAPFLCVGTENMTDT